MSAYSGITSWWATKTDAGRTHVATRVVVQNNLMLNLDAGVSSSYTGNGIVWANLVDNNSNGTLINSPTYDEQGGGNIAFNGVNNTVSITKSNPNIVGTISICVWVKYNNYNSEPIIIHKGNHYSFQMRSISGIDYWTYADSSNYNYANFGYRHVPGLYETNKWMYLTVTKDSLNDVRLYKNAVLLDTRPNFGSALTSVNSTLWLSGYSDTDTAPSVNLLNGNIAAVHIYNRALDSSEILQNYNLTKGRF